MTETLNINATEIKSISTGADTITTPKFSKQTADCGVLKVNLEGHRMKCLVMYNIAGDPEILVDLKRGITYELMPTTVADSVCTETEELFNNLMDPQSALPAGVS